VVEQMAVARWTDVRLQTVDEAVARQQHEISFLREYRTRLITDVLTGKLDVRAAAADLPNEPDEMEAPDETDPLTESEDDTEANLEAAPKEADA
jgi:type I restriction enzyme S subunit